MCVTVVQMSPGSLVEENTAAADALIRAAVADDRSDLVVLPEIWTCLGGSRAAKLAAAETLPEPGERGAVGSLHHRLGALAAELRILLHAGSIGERAGDRLFNTTLVFGPDGVERARYRKIHLFDVTTARGHSYRESDTYRAGADLATFAIGDTVAGCAICYDLRFPSLFAGLRDRGAEIVLLPAAFTSETGEAHWETLLRARAIETQCWVAAAATTGRHFAEDGGARHTHGHSMIVDPWGVVVAQLGRGEGWVTATVDPAVARRIRRDMPVWQHRSVLG